ncbi:potassium channel family protein [Ciceribacter sp. L1K22]|uniref:potassium channel family protein n=1 Tax=Ciceribacter sp. L1K22 TaxID=2820275 RepID=UPI001FEE9854|nr:potassium channel family protein [Ciceribacter sp. L1K22]
MNMLLNLALGTLMISLTVVIHTFGLMGVTQAMSWISDRIRLHRHRSRLIAMNTVVLGVFAVLTTEVWLWAICYWLIGFFDSFEVALYFSTVTFSTIGYGDVIPHPEWRLLAGMEGVDGFLLIGWSTAYLVAAGIRVGPFRSGEHF